MDMLEIKGNVNTALCYAKVVEDEAIDQIRRTVSSRSQSRRKIKCLQYQPLIWQRRDKIY